MIIHCRTKINNIKIRRRRREYVTYTKYNGDQACFCTAVNTLYYKESFYRLRYTGVKYSFPFLSTLDNMNTVTVIKIKFSIYCYYCMSLDLTIVVTKQTIYILILT